MKLRDALTLSRASNLPTVWTNVLAGVALGGIWPGLGSVLALILSMSLFYTGGMFLNDAFDSKFDAAHRSDRPIPSGRASAKSVFAIGFAMLAAGEIILVLLSCSAGSVFFGLILAAAIVFYDMRHKDVPYAPFLMGACRSLVYIAASLAFASGLKVPILLCAAVLLLYVAGISVVARRESEGRFESRWAIALIFAPVLIGLPLLLGRRIGAVIFFGFLIWTGIALRRLLKADRDIPRAVSALLAGICLVDALVILRFGGSATVQAATFAVAGFALALVFQRYVKAT